MNSNLKRIQQELIKQNQEAIILTNLTNVQWASEFTGSSAFILATQKDAFFITDTRYDILAKNEVQNYEIEIYSKDVRYVDLINNHLNQNNISSVLFEPSIQYQTFQQFSKTFEGIQLKPDEQIMFDLRDIKTTDEINRIKDACKLADATMKHATKMLQPGITEYDIQLEIEFFIRRNKASVAFGPHVVSGPNSALPHGMATERKLQNGDFVMLDLGATLNGYNSDITRTFILGDPSEEQIKMYNATLTAQQNAINQSKIGHTGKSIDKAARDHIDAQGYGELFTHSTGHGLGREVHDGKTILSRFFDVELKENQVWTIEPGIYKENFGGIRIEDDILITKEGNELLTHYPKSLEEIII